MDWRWCCIAEPGEEDLAALVGFVEAGKEVGFVVAGPILIFGPVAEQQSWWWGHSLVAEATAGHPCQARPVRLPTTTLTPPYSFLTSRKPDGIFLVHMVKKMSVPSV